jgi:hypothetical protein
MHLASLSLEPHRRAFSTPISFCRKESSLRKKHVDGVVDSNRISPWLSPRVEFFAQDHQSHHDAGRDLVPTCITYPSISKSTIPRDHPGRVYSPCRTPGFSTVRSGSYLAATYREIPHRCVGTYHQLWRPEVSEVR